MSDFTLVVQGRLTRDIFDFYKKQYKKYPVIISTWNGTKDALNLTTIPSHITFIENADPLPPDSVNQNFIRQAASTLYGIHNIDTKFSIKLRGDKYYSNLEYVMDLQRENPDKLIVNPVFFRPWGWDKAYYHISDHMISGNTQLLFNLFRNSFITYKDILLNQYKAKPEHAPEAILGNNFMKLIRGDVYSKEDFKQNILIADLNKLMPYKIVANCYNKVFYNDFIPSDHNSISDIQQL
jgi:hypothetical protein